jgi:putative glutamine amidotransferase
MPLLGVESKNRHNESLTQEIESMEYRVGVTYSEPEKLAPYISALRACSLKGVPLRSEDKPSLHGLDGLLLSGGADINPHLYGEERLPETDEPDDRRDEMELRLARAALSVDLPVLGICRGMQLLNILQGGTLIQHLEDADSHHHHYSTHEHRVLHSVETIPGSRLAAICVTAHFLVNSRHHQAVGSIGAGLMVSAWSSDTTVEALEHPDSRFALAVQWHPEDRIATVPHDRAIFDSFADAVTSECCRIRARPSRPTRLA